MPSLQSLPSSPLNPGADALLTPLRRAHVHFLALYNHLLYAASGDQIHVYETLTNTLLDTFNQDGTAAKSIAFRGGRILSAHQDCKIRIWKLNDQKKHKLVTTLPTLEDRLRRFILPQNYVKVRRHNRRLWIQHHDAVSGLAADRGNLIASISWDRSIKMMRRLLPNPLTPMQPYATVIDGLCFKKRIPKLSTPSAAPPLRRLPPTARRNAQEKNTYERAHLRHRREQTNRSSQSRGCH